MRQCLESRSAALTKELRKLVRKELEEETHLIDFEVQSHGYPGFEEQGFSFGLQWDAMDAEGGQLDEGGSLLGRTGVVIPKELYWAPEYAALDPNALAFPVLVAWFAECWEAAGGGECEYPAYIGHHDSSESFDLREKRWVKDNEKWPGGA